jgi:hypothetical protein
VGPDRKPELLSNDERLRMQQETDAILATSARLLEEMRGLIEEAERLQERQKDLLAIREAAKKKV